MVRNCRNSKAAYYYDTGLMHQPANPWLPHKEGGVLLCSLAVPADAHHGRKGAATVGTASEQQRGTPAASALGYAAVPLDSPTASGMPPSLRHATSAATATAYCGCLGTKAASPPSRAPMPPSLAQDDSFDGFGFGAMVLNTGEAACVVTIGRAPHKGYGAIPTDSPRYLFGEAECDPIPRWAPPLVHFAPPADEELHIPPGEVLVMEVPLDPADMPRRRATEGCEQLPQERSRLLSVSMKLLGLRNCLSESGGAPASCGESSRRRSSGKGAVGGSGGGGRVVSKLRTLLASMRIRPSQVA